MGVYMKIVRSSKTQMNDGSIEKIITDHCDNFDIRYE